MRAPAVLSALTIVSAVSATGCRVGGAAALGTTAYVMAQEQDHLIAATITYPQTVAVSVESRLSGGVFGYLAPGINGGKVGLGYSDTCALAGVSVRGCVLRTWNEPTALPADRTYVGADAQYRLGIYLVDVGIYVLTNGNAGDDRVILAGSIGLGTTF